MTKAQRMDAINCFVISLTFGTILVLLFGEAYRPGFVQTWAATKLLWAAMTTGSLGISAFAATSAIDSVRAAIRA